MIGIWGAVIAIRPSVIIRPRVKIRPRGVKVQAGGENPGRRWKIRSGGENPVRWWKSGQVVTLRYKSLGRLTKPTSPYSYETAARAL